MPSINCPIADCDYSTGDVEPAIAAALLNVHNNKFRARWDIFKRGTHLTLTDITQQLFQCCDESLGNDLLRGNLNVIAGTEQAVLDAIKGLAVIPVAISVRRADLLAIRQCDGEKYAPSSLVSKEKLPHALMTSIARKLVVAIL